MAADLEIAARARRKLTTLAVPEPSTWAMMLAGFASLGYAGYRRARTPPRLTLPFLRPGAEIEKAVRRATGS